MRPLARMIFALALGMLLLAMSASPGFASFERFIRVTGSASVAGSCSITIESFGLLATKGPESSSIQSFVANISIPNGSTSVNSAMLIRNGLSAVLPVDYTVSIPTGSPSFVQVSRSTGTFTMNIVSTVHPQTIVEESPVVPALGPEAIVALAGALLVGALLALRQRRRRVGGA